MTDKQPMQADGDDTPGEKDGTNGKPGPGESAGGAYPNPHTGKTGGKSFDGGQTHKSYEGPDNPNSTTE